MSVATFRLGTLPDEDSALVLVAARLRHMAGTKWDTRRYLNMDRLRDAEGLREEAIVGSKSDD